MGPREVLNWADKYRNSDHHTDRLVRTKVSYERSTGRTFPEPARTTNNSSKMTWGRGQSTNVVQVTTTSRRAASVPVADMAYEPHRRTAYTVSSAREDADYLSSASKKHDQALLGGIQTRLNRLEYDSVKPGRDVKVKTGFRRFIYGYKPPLEKETIEERRMDKLRYPWENRDNIYCAPRRKKSEKTKRRDEVDEEKEGRVKDLLKEVDHYPEFDPMGLYRPREKRKHIKLEDVVLDKEKTKKYDDRSVEDLMANLRAKAKAMTVNDNKEGRDIDEFIHQVAQPIPSSGPIDIYVPAGEGEYVFTEREDLNPDISRKLRDSRADLDEFDRLLNQTFKPKPFSIRPRPIQPVKSTRSRDYNPYMDFGDDDVDLAGPSFPQAQSFSVPPPPSRSRSHTRRAASTRPSSRRGSVCSVTSTSSARRPVEDEDFEIQFPANLTTRNLPPCARRALNRDTYHQRSQSLPPSPLSREEPRRVSTAFKSSGGGFIDLGSPLFRVVDGGSTVKPSYMSSYARDLDQRVPRAKVNREEIPRPHPIPQARRRYSFAFEDPSEFRRRYDYTPQLRTAHAYEISRPRPFVRRHVPIVMPPYQAPVYVREAEFYVPDVRARTTGSGFRARSEPRHVMRPGASLAVRQARDSLNRIEQELGMGSVTLDSEAPYYDEPVVTATHIRPVTASRSGWIRGSVPVPTQRRPSYTYGVSSRPPPVPRASRQHEIEARLEMMIAPETATPASYASLRDRTSNARNKMDQHRTLIDRYLPCPTGPLNDVPYEVEYRFKELQDRMPQLRPRDRTVRAASLPPVTPVSAPIAGRVPLNTYNDALRRPAFKPTMSDTRKRARDVLCRTKRDPHYFDY